MTVPLVLHNFLYGILCLPGVKMSQSHLESVRAMYDERSDDYDEDEVHSRQAGDFCRWADLKEGEAVLDLACGTGLVALGAKKQVGDSGHVVGVDISEKMLAIARLTAEYARLEVTFFNHDVSDLGAIRELMLPFGKDGFDVITCASALILLPDPLRAVKNWTPLLRPGGRIITDVQTKDANVNMNIFSDIAPEVGESVLWHSNLWQSQKALGDLMVGAGLQVERVFETYAYGDTRYNLSQAEQLFETAVTKAMFKNFGRQEIRDKAKKLYLKHFADIVGPAGWVDEETKYWVVVASKES